jgi:NADH-quinone oxidoreductase subunit J
MPLDLIKILFLLNAAVILGAAVISVTVRNLVHAALWMVLSFFSVAILFVFMGIGFFAVIQVTIYIGAIAVLILFAIMLTRRGMQEHENTHLKYIWAGGLVAVGLFIVLFFMLRLFPAVAAIPVQSVDQLVPQLGLALSEPRQYGLVFELASVLLLAALIGAIYLAFDRKSAEGEPK